MKHITLLIILSILSLPNLAQDEFPFVKEGAVWSESRFGLSIPLSYYHYGMLGDTVIQNTTYKKVYIWQGITSDINIAPKELFGFVKEENKIVTITYSSNFMDTLFNVNWVIGDSLGAGGDDTGMLFSSKIRSIDSVSINGEYRKRWNFYAESTTLPADTFPIFSYIDGIGTDRFTFFSAQQPYFDKVFRLLCYQEDNTQIYVDPNSNTCGFITNIHQVNWKDSLLKIFPNPASEVLNIYFKNPNQPKDGIFRLIDLQGRVVVTFDADKNDTTYLVPLEKYASGIYFLQYAEKGIPLSTQQIIIQK